MVRGRAGSGRRCDIPQRLVLVGVLASFGGFFSVTIGQRLCPGDFDCHLWTAAIVCFLCSLSCSLIAQRWFWIWAALIGLGQATYWAWLMQQAPMQYKFAGLRIFLALGTTGLFPAVLGAMPVWFYVTKKRMNAT